MYLFEIAQTGVLQLMHQINDAFAADDDVIQREIAARHLAFLMVYRDLDFNFKDQEINPLLPIETFLRPGIQTSIAALQQFAKSVGDDKSIDKRVLRYTKRFLDPQDGNRYFKYQLTKLQDYFKQRHNGLNQTKTKEDTTSP